VQAHDGRVEIMFANFRLLIKEPLNLSAFVGMFIFVIICLPTLIYYAKYNCDGHKFYDVSECLQAGFDNSFCANVFDIAEKEEALAANQFACVIIDEKSGRNWIHKKNVIPSFLR
jgi:hypothetical protein